ncbi:MBL fold metallo-hydrolase [Pseudomonas chlororaphis]|uniref:MBL fold metallo-hydrolase n=1 Tax=Pseudomonas chlororaphis TaxID=587753 RepID=UPI000BE30FEF|nr:MBL fold metallo-hydrolase [Pseudomonas chlororaphis]
MRVTLGMVILLLVQAATYGGEDDNLNIWRGQGLAEPKIQYLGVGGWLLHWRGEGVLLAPLFSNPSMFGRWPPIAVKADPQRIDAAIGKLQVDDVTMLLIGHGHYDHLLDVPWIMLHHAPAAMAYGSRTVVRMLHLAKVPAQRIKDVEDSMQVVAGCLPERTAVSEPQWQTSSGGHIRALPIQSMHASHLLGYTIASGEAPEGLTELPGSVFGWKQGQSMAWLIDLLDKPNGEVAYRIHFQDSAATAPCGIPVIGPKEKRVDVEILGVGSWRHAHDYPGKLLQATRPRLVLLGHWENFFRNGPGLTKALPGQHVAELVDRVSSLVEGETPPVQIYLPAPFAQMALPQRSP